MVKGTVQTTKLKNGSELFLEDSVKKAEIIKA